LCSFPGLQVKERTVAAIIGDIDISRRIDGNPGWVAEIVLRAAEFSAGVGGEAATLAENQIGRRITCASGSAWAGTASCWRCLRIQVRQNAVVVEIGDPEIVRGIDGKPVGIAEGNGAQPALVAA
jgi:hypothetical protein